MAINGPPWRKQVLPPGLFLDHSVAQYVMEFMLKSLNALHFDKAERLTMSNNIATYLFNVPDVALGSACRIVTALKECLKLRRPLP